MVFLVVSANIIFKRSLFASFVVSLLFGSFACFVLMNYYTGKEFELFASVIVVLTVFMVVTYCLFSIYRE